MDASLNPAENETVREIFFSERANEMPINAHRMKFILNLMKEKKFVYPSDTSRKKPHKTKKDSNKSNELRKRGNACFIAKDYTAALEAYNEALCYAPIDSKLLASLYADRATIYFDTGFYGFCLENIKLALDHKYPKKLQMDLLKRKAACEEKKATEEDSFDIYGNPDKPKLSYPANPKIPFMIEGLKCVKNEKFGRHIVTTRDLHPGDIVLIEEPFMHYVNPSGTFRHCFHCGRNNFFNLKPCPTSISVMFCSTKCVDESWDRYYKYQVNVVDEPRITHYAQPALRATLRAFTMVNEVDELKDMIASIDVEAENALNLDWTRASEKDKFRVLYSLATNETKHPNNQMFYFQMYLALIYCKLKEQEEFKRLIASDEHEILFLNLLQRLCLISNVNSHQLTGRFVLNQSQKLETPEQGQGVHLLLALLSHSCCPNTRRIRTGQSTALIISRPVKAGEQLFSTYGPHFKSHPRETRKELLNNYYFECECAACLNDYPDQTLHKAYAMDFIPKQIQEEIKTFRAFKFDQEMPKVIENLVKSLPEVITKGEKYYPRVQVSVLEETLGFCKQFSLEKRPLNLILESKNNL